MAYRSEIPTDEVCSPDGSLLAVAYGGHVVVYELSTNVPRVVLTCPELKEVLHVTFVGKSGRYIAAANRRAIVLWDLVTTNGELYLSVFAGGYDDLFLSSMAAYSTPRYKPCGFSPRR